MSIGDEIGQRLDGAALQGGLEHAANKTASVSQCELPGGLTLTYGSLRGTDGLE